MAPHQADTTATHARTHNKEAHGSSGSGSYTSSLLEHTAWVTSQYWTDAMMTCQGDESRHDNDTVDFSILPERRDVRQSTSPIHDDSMARQAKRASIEQYIRQQEEALQKKKPQGSNKTDKTNTKDQLNTSMEGSERSFETLLTLDSDAAHPYKFEDEYDENEESHYNKHRKCCNSTNNKLPYEFVFWIFHAFVLAIALADRFLWNVWPRQAFTIGSGTSGTDRVALKEGPWSVVFYDVFARFSGRFSIVAFNLLLISRMRCLMHILTTRSWFTDWFVNTWIDTSDMVNANNRLHKYNGIALVVGTLIHVWSILLPCVTHGWSSQVIVGTFEWPLSERAPPGFKDVNASTKTISLEVDDIFRMVLMTILLGILMPLSVRWLSRRWHIGIHLHNFVMTIYFVDIVRRHTHPHSWVFNTPVFVMYLLDLLWSKFCWRRHVPEQMHRVCVGRDYMVLYWNHPYSSDTDTVGPDYFLLLRDSSICERAHVFTAFDNRNDIVLDEGVPNSWTVGTVIRVFRNKRVPQLGKKEPTSHTMRMYNSPTLDVTAWGPTQGEMSEIVKKYVSAGDCPVTIIGAGSGINYVMDALQRHYLLKRKSDSSSLSSAPLVLCFTTRDNPLYHWAQRVMTKIITVQGTAPTKLVLAYTGKTKDADVPHGCEYHRIDKPALPFASDGTLSFISGRIDFGTELPRNGVVFCQGSHSLKEAVRSACKKTHNRFFGGRGGGS